MEENNSEKIVVNEEKKEAPVSPEASVAKEAPKSDHALNTAMGVIAYILFFVPLLTDAKNDPFVKFHVKQGLLVFLIGLGAWVLSPVLFMLTWIIHLFVLVMVVLGIVNVLNNKKEPLPLIGQFAEKFNF